jgi:hypothetical protein
MDPNTEIVSGFTVGDYLAMRERLNSAIERTSDWNLVIGALHGKQRQRG